MAEILGVVASGIAVAQLAGKLVSTTQELYILWRGIKSAPKQVGDALQEIEFLGKIISGLQIENDEEEIGGNEVIREALTYCCGVIGEFDGVLRDLGRKMGTSGVGKRHWGAFKVSLKSQTLSDFERRLERAKSILGLAVDSYSMSMHRRQVSMLSTLIRSQNTLRGGVEATEVRISDENLELLPSRTKSSSNTTVVTKWYGLGWMQTISRASKRLDRQFDFNGVDEEVDWKFIPAPWLRSRGFTASQRNIFGQWQYCFAPICIVPDSSTIFEACRMGNLDQVIKLVRNGEATVFDVSEKGWSLLHVAAAHLRPGLCRWLILQGVRSDSIDVEWGRTPLHIAANQSGRDLDWTRYGGFMKAIDNVRRPSDAQDTIRILVEEGQCDPMAKTPANTPEHLYGSQTSLHLHTGSVDAFNYLIHQNHFMIDWTARNQIGLTPAMDQLFSGWPNSSELAGLSVQCNPAGLNIQRHKALFNMTNLHIAADRLRYHEIKMSNGCKKVRDIIGNTISVLLQCGADVHAVDDYGRTSLQYLCQRGYQGQIGRICEEKDSRQDLCARLTLWLELLKKTGYDLHKYFQKEFSLDTVETGMEPPPEIYLQSYGGPRTIRSLRTLRLEKQPLTDDFVFKVKDTRVENVRDGEDGDFEPAIPGAWNASLDSRSSEINPQIAELQIEISILIRSSAEGVQEFVIQ